MDTYQGILFLQKYFLIQICYLNHEQKDILKIILFIYSDLKENNIQFTYNMKIHFHEQKNLLQQSQILIFQDQNLILC